MKKSFLSNTNPTLFSWSAVIIGTILCEELTVNEQNAIGNWLQLVGEYLLTYASQVALINANNSEVMNNNQKIDKLEETLKRMEKELEQIKKDYFKE